VLASRIDRLGAEEKELLQTLSVLGREFPLTLVRNVLGTPTDELERLLSRLQLSEFIYEQPAFPEVEYVFKHALTQEVAYNSVLGDRRKLLHERAGAAMEALYADRLEDHLSELARHYERSGNITKAVEYLGRAGHQAISRASHAEAITLFTSALELIKTLPATPGRLKKELTLKLGLGSALQPVKGFSSPEVGQTFSRAFELCQQIEATPELFQVILGLTNFYYMRLELSRAHELAEHLVAISERDGDAVSLIAAHMTRGVGLLTQGNFTVARDHLERAASFVSSAHRSIYGPAALCWHGAISLYLGYPDKALDQNRAALALARELSDPFTYINALHSAQLVHQLRGDWKASLALADDTLRLSTEHGFQQYSALAMAYRGRALTQLEHAEKGLAALQQGLTAMRNSGMHLLTLSYAMLAESYAKAGYTADGLSVATEGLESSDRTGDVGWKAELFRIRGDLLVVEGKSTSVNEAEACFRQAIEIAEHQQAKWWELRATLSLARLLAHQGKRKEASMMLGEIYNWFTEGFDTAELKDAKALLDELRV
jgi:tetratricopeptide (TPR) repeat protein